MRLAIGLGLAALLALAPAASAQGPAVTLAPGELLLEISAFGRARTAPDQLQVEASLYSSGATEEAARRDIDALVARVRAPLRALGLADGEIVITDPYSNSDYAMMNAMDMNMAMMDVDDGSTPLHSFTATLRVQTRNVALGPRIELALSETGVMMVDGMRYTLSNQVGAMRAARADAIARARAQAEDYAAGLNMRVTRMVRLSERSGPNFMEMMMGATSGPTADLQRELAENPDSATGVNSIVYLGVDFALAPR